MCLNHYNDDVDDDENNNDIDIDDKFINKKKDRPCFNLD